jgi:hypothetical protein
MTKTLLSYWPLILAVVAVALWSIIDFDSYLEFEGLVLLALMPLGFWALVKALSKGR